MLQICAQLHVRIHLLTEKLRFALASLAYHGENAELPIQDMGPGNQFRPYKGNCQ